MHQPALFFIKDSRNWGYSGRSDPANDYFWQEADCLSGVALYFIVMMLVFASAGNVHSIWQVRSSLWDLELLLGQKKAKSSHLRCLGEDLILV